MFSVWHSPCPHVADSATEDAQAETEHCHVAEVEAGLEQSVHPADKTTEERSDNGRMSAPCFEEEIVEGVEEDVSGGRAGREKGGPLPPGMSRL